MLIIKAIILGAIQGITEFFPISSSGHLSLLSNIMGVEIDLSFMIILHLSTLIAVILYFKKDFIKCITELYGIIKDLLYNTKSLMTYRGSIEGPDRRIIISNAYRKLTVMLLISTAVTVVIAMFIHPFTEIFNKNLLCSGFGMFVTALVLLVTSFTERQRRGPKESKYQDAVIIGAFQGISAFPGISRFAMSYSAGRICGFTLKYNKLYCFLLMIPSIIGAAILECTGENSLATNMGFLPSLCGAAAALFFGYHTIRIAVKFISTMSMRKFAYYCAAIGFVSIILYLL